MIDHYTTGLNNIDIDVFLLNIAIHRHIAKKNGNT
jgi:hypothetical protein